VLNLSVISEFAATRARFAEVTMTGTPSAGFVQMHELYLFPSAPFDPAPSTADGYDLTYLRGVSASANSNLLFPYPASALLDRNYFTYLGGKPIAQGGTGDGIAIIDLGGWYAISEVALMFNATANWTGGEASRSRQTRLRGRRCTIAVAVPCSAQPRLAHNFSPSPSKPRATSESRITSLPAWDRIRAACTRCKCSEEASRAAAEIWNPKYELTLTARARRS
jgi:hypothetical protein